MIVEGEVLIGNTENYVLKDINITIKSNDIIGIIGENGSSKTTFIKLLCDFYDNYGGNIYINGIELRDVDRTHPRENMGIIFQDFNKYEFTLIEK